MLSIEILNPVKFRRRAYSITLIKIALLILMLAVPHYAQPASSVELLKLKVVWVQKFLNYIVWPDEQKVKIITISYWGNDSRFYENLFVLNGKKIRSSHIKVVRQSDITSPASIQVIVVGQENSHLLGKLQSALSGKSTLVISDNAASQQNTMINFVYPEANAISFELNRYNIMYEKLSLSAEIIVLGGTEVDIANVLHDMNTELVNKKVLLDKRENTLRALSNDIEQRQQQYTLLKQEMNKLLLTLNNSRAELSNNDESLDDKQKQLTDKEKDIKKLSQAIDVNKVTLVQQKTQLEQHKKRLASQDISLVNQEKRLSNKRLQIQLQYIAIILSFSLILFALMVVFRMKKTSNNKKKYLKVLSAKNVELAQTNEQLLNTQSQLVRSEKMVALGSLVAGVAHEINTPLGVSVTAVSTCQHLLDTFASSVQQNKVTRKEMHTFLDKLNQATTLITTNLNRANVLIRQFKLVAVDQSSEEQREFLLYDYLNELLSSLYPQYKQYHCDIVINCDDKITMNSFPGAIAQIITNLVMNSILHGFTIENKALIQLDVKIENKDIIILYQDNGTGIARHMYTHVFTPFYTTKRGRGGSGLGLHICYNIASKLGGDIKCLPCESGAKFIIIMAKELAIK